MDSDICHLYGFTRSECQFYRCNYRCDAYLAVDGTYHGSGAFSGSERFRADEALVEKFPDNYAVQCHHGYRLFPGKPGCRGAVGVAGAYLTDDL